MVPQWARVALTLLGTVAALFSHFVEVFLAAPPRPQDRIWKTIRDGAFGHFDFLTVNVEVINALYWVFSLVGEVAWWLLDVARYPFFEKVIVLSYSLASFSASLATMLTILFIMFVWLDPKFQDEVVAEYEKRGNTVFRYKIVATHCNQIPFALLDALIIKQTKQQLLTHTSPTLWTLLGICLGFNLVYLATLHLNYSKNGRVWIYPFMDESFKTIKGEVVFVISLSLFNFGIAALYHFVAVEAEWAELMWRAHR